MFLLWAGGSLFFSVHGGIIVWILNNQINFCVSLDDDLVSGFLLGKVILDVCF